MRTATLLVVLTLALASMAFGQAFTWQHMGVFPPAGLVKGDTIFGGDVHGIAVDPEGKVWIQLYGTLAKDSIFIPNYCTDTAPPYDSVSGRWSAVRMLHVYNPNGTEVSWSPIKFADVPGGKRDTLGGESVVRPAPFPQDVKVWFPSLSVNTGRGLRKAPDGNIYATYFGYVYAFNYKTGVCLGKAVGNSAASGTAVGVDSLNYIYFRTVAGGNALRIFDNNFAFVSNAADTALGFARATEVSKSGEEIYDAAYTLHYVKRWYALGALPPYQVRPVDTLFKGFDCESIAWDPRGRLWASTGSYNDRPNRYPGVATTYDTSSWYATNPATNTVLNEKINWVYYTPYSANERPRGIGFSPTGDTAYVSIFGGTLPTPGVRRYRRVPVSVEPDGNAVPEVYTLSQNYPNPFNPSTEIQFAIPKQGMTTVKVYDILGQEVATLVNEMLAPGSYKTRLDGARLASGTYIYMIQSGDFRMSKKMLLLK